MFPHFFKTTFALFICFSLMSTSPLSAGQRSAETTLSKQVKRIVANNLFVIPFRTAASFKRLISPAGSVQSDIAECWGYLTLDNLQGLGYPYQTAFMVGGEAMRNYPGLDLTVEYAISQGVSFEDIAKVLANCMVYCGWE